MTNVKEIAKYTVGEVAQAVAENTPLVVLDVLPEEIFEARHIPGAQNVCVFEVGFTDAVAALGIEPEMPIVVVGEDHHTHDMRVAAEKLQRAGYSEVGQLDGGMADWVALGYPVDGSNHLPSPDAIGTALLADHQWQLDAEASIIHWEGRNPNGSHDGTVGLDGGHLWVRNGEVDGDITVNMQSIRNRDLAGDDLYGVLIDHLLSDDFFFVSQFPKAVFTVDRVDPVADPMPGAANVNVYGRFQLCGIERTLVFPGTVNAVEDGIAVEAHFDIDRTDWGVVYGSSRFFTHLGKHLVHDIISIGVRLIWRPE